MARRVWQNLDLALPYLVLCVGLAVGWWCLRRCTDCGLEAMWCMLPAVIGAGASFLGLLLAIARTYYRNLDFRRLDWLGPLLIIPLAVFLMLVL